MSSSTNFVQPPHHIQGIGAGFVPKVLDREVIDEIVSISERAAMEYTRRLAREEGILAGISSGGAIFATLELAKQIKNSVLVTIICDRGDRYLSTDVFPA